MLPKNNINFVMYLFDELKSWFVFKMEYNWNKTFYF